MKIIISEKAYPETFDYFRDKGFEVIVFQQQNRPYEGVGHHPDMFVFYDEHLFVEKHVSLNGIRCEAMGEKYPDTVKFNIAVTEDYVICKSDAMSRVIKEHVEKTKEIIHVNQGYAKCATAVIGKAIITSDKGIYKATKEKMDVLLIEQGHILLPGFDYGFIGGTCTCFDQTVYFNGDIKKHPNYDKIHDFITNQGYSIDCVNQPLMDIGSMIIIERSE